MAEIFIDCFVNIIGQTGDDSFTTCSFNGKILVTSRIENFIRQYNILSITTQEVTDCIDKLSGTKVTGLDAISLSILKLVTPVTRLLNLSIVNGNFLSNENFLNS